MTFECKHCGKRWEEKGYTKEGTFFTLCRECGEQVLYEWKMGVTKVELQKIKQKRRKKNK